MNITTSNISGYTIANWNGTDIYEWLESNLGARRQPLPLGVFLTVVYIIIFVTGVVGNVSTFIVVARNRYMHTATNYYLCNLVISDLLQLLLGLPQEAYAFWSAYPWMLGEAFCAVRTMAAETATYASILTITAFTVERYVAICHPIRAKVISRPKRAINSIALVWVIACCSSVPVWIQYGVVYIPDNDGRAIIESAICSIRAERSIGHIFELSSVVFFVIPMTIISVLYALIGISIRKSTMGAHERDNSSEMMRNRTLRDSDDGRSTNSDYTQHWRAVQQAKSRLSVLKMLACNKLLLCLISYLSPESFHLLLKCKIYVTPLMLSLVAVVVAFFICWAPFHVQRLLFTYMASNHYPGEAFFFYMSGILYFVSAVINPILYNIMSLKFRQAFMDTLCRPCLSRSSPNSWSSRRPVSPCLTPQPRRCHPALKESQSQQVIYDSSGKRSPLEQFRKDYNGSMEYNRGYNGHQNDSSRLFQLKATTSNNDATETGGRHSKSEKNKNCLGKFGLKTVKDSNGVGPTRPACGCRYATDHLNVTSSTRQTETSRIYSDYSRCTTGNTFSSPENFAQNTVACNACAAYMDGNSTEDSMESSRRGNKTTNAKHNWISLKPFREKSQTML